MKSRTNWVLATILLIWIAVFILSVASADLVTGTLPDQTRIPVGAFIDWIWGVLATVSVLRATVFVRIPHNTKAAPSSATNQDTWSNGTRTARSV